jgi:tetratricopeptide (TPR) repeat protein
MIIAGVHEGHLVYPHYGPHHVRALLRKFQPDAVGVENDRDWHGQQKLVFPFLVELYVAMDWAMDNGIPAYGIDWQEQTLSQSEPDSSGRSEFSQSVLAGDPEARNQIARGADSHTRQMSSIVYSDIRQDALYMHTSDIVQFLKRFERWPAEWREPLEARDQHIADNVLAVVQEEHVQRLAVVIGGGHLPGLHRRLSEEPGVEWVDATELLPLSDLEVEVTLGDVYWLLSRHLDGIDMEWHKQQHDWRRTHDLLQRALSEAPDSAVTRYFQARWDWWMGNDRKAETVLQELTELDPDFAFPFPINSIWIWPPLSSVRVKAMFSLANLYDYRGERDKALALYGKLVQLGESLNVYGHQIAFTSRDVREYIESFLEEPYCRCAEEWYRPKGYFHEHTPEDLRTVPWLIDNLLGKEY